MSIKNTLSGIVSFGSYVPRFRITADEIAIAHGEKDGTSVKKGLKIAQKSVPGFDEDVVTMSIESGCQAIQRRGLNPHKIGALYIGSESHPYAVKPSASIVGQSLGFGNEYMAVDMQFACKAGTAAMQCVAGQVASGMIDYGMAIGGDTAQARPGDALEYTAGAGAAAFILGNKEEEILAKILETVSYTSDTPDFWRRPKASYPQHAERFTGKPAYLKHLLGAGNLLLQKTQTEPSDYDYIVLHQPNGKFPRVAAKKLGFTEEQLAPCLVVEEIGNCYAGSALMGLVAVLEVAKPAEKIFFVSYGSGSGSDGFSFEVTNNISNYSLSNPLSEQLKKTSFVSYDMYQKLASH